MGIIDFLCQTSCARQQPYSCRDNTHPNKWIHVHCYTGSLLDYQHWVGEFPKQYRFWDYPQVGDGSRVCMPQYGEMSLRDEPGKRHAKVSGRKGELVERLEADDRNANFGHSDMQQDDFNMIFPNMTTYRDINTNSR
ncbi:hypothetical protein LSAT2_000994 [Lamellibrachia satsuma]|nr:hypothetical protein LSAT2_000994 [Lamellibrachia satsuma]